MSEIKTWLADNMFGGLQEKAAVVKKILVITFVLALLALFIGVCVYTETKLLKPKHSDVVLVPKSKIVLIGNQYYIPVKFTN